MVGNAAVRLESCDKDGGQDAQSAKASDKSAKAELYDNLVLTYETLSPRLQIPKRTLERLVSKNLIPHRKVGKRCVRFYWPAIETWLLDWKGAKVK